MPPFDTIFQSPMRVCSIYNRDYSYPLRKYELIDMLSDVVSKWKLLIFAISIAEKTIQKA